MLPEEFDEIWFKERYLIAHGWYRAPESGMGMWQKFDPFGSYIMPLEKAYDYEDRLHPVN